MPVSPTVRRREVVLWQRFHSGGERPHSRCDERVKFRGRGGILPPGVEFCPPPRVKICEPPHTRSGALRKFCKARGLRCETRAKFLNASHPERGCSYGLCGRLHPERPGLLFRTLPSPKITLPSGGFIHQVFQPPRLWPFTGWRDCDGGSRFWGKFRVSLPVGSVCSSSSFL